MIANFVREIEHLLALIPSGQWEDPGVCGVVYELLPWHTMSSITIQVREDDVRDRAGWKYYYSAESDTSLIKEEIARYQQGNGSWIYHDLLIEAAEAFLSIDMSDYDRPLTVEGGRLYHPFQVQVFDADKAFSFNYCEYVLAKRRDAK